MKTYRKLVNFLKKEYPSSHPVSVRKTKIPDTYDGYCQFKDGRFHIKINKKLSEHEAIDTLLHEYAHIIAWNKCKSDAHCDEWGKAFSRLYRAFLKEFIET